MKEIGTKLPDIQLNQVACLGDQKYPSFELKTIVDYLKLQGEGDWVTQLLISLELTETDLDGPFISAHQALTALEKTMDRFYEPGFGHRVASTFRLENFQAIGSCVGQAKSLGEALSISNAYYDLIGSFNDVINLEDERIFTQRLVNVFPLDKRVMRFLFEMTVSGIMTLGRELSGQSIPLDQVSFGENLSAEELAFYRDLYKTDINTGAKFHEWSVEQTILHAPLPDRKVNMVNAEQDLKQILTMLHEDQGLVDDIDCILKGSAGDFPDPEMISHALGISPRTLRRRLSKVGTSYSALIDKVRCQLALNLIQNRQLCNEALASELGYSDAANFCNAFKKWTGHAPSYYRL